MSLKLASAGSEGTAVVIEPMGIARLLDRSLRLLPQAFRQVLLWYVILAILKSAVNFASLEHQIGKGGDINASLTVLVIVGTVLSALLEYFFYLAITFLVADAWLGREVELGKVVQHISLGRAFRIFYRWIGLSIWVGLVTILGLFLFIIPGLIYALNRIMSIYVVILEDSPVSEAIEKSKLLMSQEKWYSLHGAAMKVTCIAILSFVLSFFPGLMIGGAESLKAGFVVSPLLALFLQFFGQLFVYFVGVFNMICYVGLYYDLCARYEAADLISGIEQLNLQGPAA